MGKMNKKHTSVKMRKSFVKISIILAGIACLVPPIAYLLAYLTHSLTHPIFFILSAVVIVFIIGVVGGFFITRRFAQPIEQLNEEARKFAAGDYDIKFEVENGTQEVEEMARSLNAITQSTRAAVAELKAEEQRQRQFVSDVSHEIRTPLTGIRGNAETLLDGSVPLEDQQRFLGIIISECDRLTRLANDLLELQRIEASSQIELKRVDLRQVVEKVHDMLMPLFESREVEVSISGEAPDILGDEDKITQVLVNLLENASRFAKSHVHVELSGLKGQSVITVSDDGKGFGDIDPSRLFDRFYRGDKSRSSATGGTGLGLAIVKSIVTSHDGTVEAFNIPSGGACFAVGIPSIAPK